MESLRRKVQAQKFYTTLPHKVDNAVEEFKQATPEPDPELEWYFEEVGEFGQEGWTISYRHKSVEEN